MNKEHKANLLDLIMNQAKRDKKGHYSVYHYYCRKIEFLDLEPKEFEQAIRELSNILRV